MSADGSSALEGWAKLRFSAAAPADREILTQSTDIETGYGAVRFALGPAGESRLLLPLSGNERLRDLQNWGSLELKSIRLEVEGRIRDFLDLMCRDSALEAVFGEVSNEILSRVKQGRSGVEACMTTLEDFRHLLSSPPGEVEVRKVRGLLGELIYLDRLLETTDRAWELWRGPLEEGERHDFRGANRSVEIKTVSRVSTTKVRISSIDQLAIPVEGSLHLVRMVLEHAAGASLAVGTVVERILPRCSNPDEVLIRLGLAGCTDYRSAAWNAFAFHLQEEEMYKVDENFPRIVAHSFRSGMVPTGISALQYDVDLSTARACILDSVAAEQVARDIIECL